MKKLLLAGALASSVIAFLPVTSVAAAKPAAHVQQKVNLNTADAKQLVKVKGIGKTRAARIVAYRKAHGDFKSVADLSNVKGISKTLANKLGGELTV